MRSRKSCGAHTVLTPALPGEFSPPFHDSQHGHSRHFSPRVVNSSELDLAVLDVLGGSERIHTLLSPNHLSLALASRSPLTSRSLRKSCSHVECGLPDMARFIRCVQ
jgi:hypothetical protein